MLNFIQNFNKNCLFFNFLMFVAKLKLKIRKRKKMLFSRKFTRRGKFGKFSLQKLQNVPKSFSHKQKLTFKFSTPTESVKQNKISIEDRLAKIKQENIRNFCIIAHIDHGKSTLADRLIEHCREGEVQHDQVLDKLQVEQDRGITVKA
jgi:hypothetical protein